MKEFTTFQERKIICKTHRSILNSCLKAQINKIKTSIKSKCNYNDFIDVSNTIIKFKEKVFKITKNHLHFNLRCLSQNIVKLNMKEFTTFQERKIICKTHRSILNSHVRQCNRIIDNLKAQINKIKTNIKSKCNYNDFIDVSNTIIKSKEKVFKITKNCQIKKFTHLQKYPKYRNTPVPDIIR